MLRMAAVTKNKTKQNKKKSNPKHTGAIQEKWHTFFSKKVLRKKQQHIYKQKVLLFFYYVSVGSHQKAGGTSVRCTSVLTH